MALQIQFFKNWHIKIDMQPTNLSYNIDENGSDELSYNSKSSLNKNEDAMKNKRFESMIMSIYIYITSWNMTI